MYTSLTVAIIAKTMDDAPLRPDHAINSLSAHVYPFEHIANTAAGRDIKVITANIASAGSIMPGSCEGFDSNPSRKNSIIWLSPVIPSKKCTSCALFSPMLLLPMMIPAMYTLRYPLPPSSIGAEYAANIIAIIKIMSKLFFDSFTFFITNTAASPIAKPNATPRTICSTARTPSCEISSPAIIASAMTVSI